VFGVMLIEPRGKEKEGLRYSREEKGGRGRAAVGGKPLMKKGAPGISGQALSPRKGIGYRIRDLI